MLPNLTDYLCGQNPGRLLDTAELERHLADSWGSFEGNHAEGMTPEKLLGRMEKVEWLSPMLTFLIERHGGICLGSTRAELHRWSVNVTDKTAVCERVGHRQLRPMARRLSIQPMAEEVASKIVQGQGDERLIWEGEGTVRVVLSAIFPAGSGFKQTIEGRRKRFKQALNPLLEKSGWRHVGRCLFSKLVPPVAPSNSRI